ncbi:hypothetical protein [Microvirga sp. 2TAF3]|uniref:hypothetical protein n=1 Tax=Microvirga sp. 2TAF3 TaxID=3233014 RepID=UPI003F95DBBE
MTEEEIEVVAAELAKVGGVAWYPGRGRGPILRAVSERYRDRARVAIAALERFRASKEGVAASQGSITESPAADESPASGPDDQLRAGIIVVYRPPGDQRAISCMIDKIEGGRAYLIPCPKPDVGWVSLDELSPVNPEDTHKRNG